MDNALFNDIPVVIRLFISSIKGDKWRGGVTKKTPPHLSPCGRTRRIKQRRTMKNVKRGIKRRSENNVVAKAATSRGGKQRNNVARAATA